jgi:RNA polymerase sigma-70 factor (ECF subfamily)
MTSITRYRAIDVLRKRRSRPEKDSLEWAEVSPSSIPRLGDGPEELADLLLQQQRVRQAVSSLSSDQQVVLSLAYFQGLSHSQIAAQLNQPLGTVKTRIRLAMHRLREALKEEV